MNIDNHIEAKYRERERLKQEIKKNQGWYFIDFLGNIPRHRPYGFTLFNRSLVLFKDTSDSWNCYSLPTSNQNDSLKFTSFTVEEKEGEIWFWRGNDNEIS